MTGLRRSASCQAMLDLEDAGSPLLEERLPGSPVPFWMQVRQQFFMLLSADEFGEMSIPATSGIASVLWRMGRSTLPARDDAARWRRHRDLVFVVGGTTRHTRDGRAWNWLVGDYADALAEQAIIVQRSPLASPLGRPAFEPTRTMDPMLARAEVAIALRRGRPSPNDDRVRELMAALADLLGVTGDPRLPGLVDSAVWAERVRPSVDREFARFLDRTSPKALVFEDGSYGSAYASMIAIAHERGIVVAEPQHGWIGPAHGAYNYGATGFRPASRVGIPDVLLTFGEYWSEGVAWPGAVVPVGKPHLEERVAAAPPVAERPREVLVVSSVSYPEETLAFLERLRAALPADWTVAFRPHPSERAVLSARYPGLRSMPGVTIDDRSDAYDALVASRIVVGVASTMLFEAAALGCRVFVRDSLWVPIIVGELFGEPLVGAGDVERIATVARDPDSTDDGRPAGAVDSLWKPDPVGAFADWFASVP